MSWTDFISRQRALQANKEHRADVRRTCVVYGSTGVRVSTEEHEHTKFDSLQNSAWILGGEAKGDVWRGYLEKGSEILPVIPFLSFAFGLKRHYGREPNRAWCKTVPQNSLGPREHPNGESSSGLSIGSRAKVDSMPNFSPLEMVDLLNIF
ncbi:hypothetical protein JAAARDRAFT_31426 [Jaapia argillacea MUCL 33604]|uniref:Uncharacterized protein n=1 Tax=Jaapia argillacea MUCL 33604 TaxID=933084 RepID=A0A067Q4P5_9AGAM|nr:hypothetical protein JAAARDRAFT_31426 [Jaapia argillacea MUCL 33604]